MVLGGPGGRLGMLVLWTAWRIFDPHISCEDEFHAVNESLTCSPLTASSPTCLCEPPKSLASPSDPFPRTIPRSLSRSISGQWIEDLSNLSYTCRARRGGS